MAPVFASIFSVPMASIVLWFYYAPNNIENTWLVSGLPIKLRGPGALEQMNMGELTLQKCKEPSISIYRHGRLCWHETWKYLKCLSTENKLNKLWLI